MVAVRPVVPSDTDLPSHELRENQSAVLARIADVMDSPNRHGVDELIGNVSPQGLSHFRQRYDVRELMTENRLLRRVIIEEAERVLDRPMTQAEHAALDMSIDAMLQETVYELRRQDVLV